MQCNYEKKNTFLNYYFVTIGGGSNNYDKIKCLIKTYYKLIFSGIVTSTK